MLSRIALLASALLLTAPAFAANTVPSGAEICRQTIPTIRDAWQHDVYDAPPAVSALMVDVIDGKLPQVRQQLVALKPAEAAQWRQVAMLTAVYAGQAAIVDVLLDDGAAVDGTAWLPPFKPNFYRQNVDGMKRDPRFGGPDTVNGLAARGLLNNRGQPVGPALPIAAECSDTAAVDVLLKHHADVTAREAPNIADALDAAIVNGDAAIVQRLLDHGANACTHDRLGRARALKTKRPLIPLAEVGRRAGLPAALIARLTCPTLATTH